ncbi:NAD(+)--rifampin ADP-ribosyltransferase [Vagococcus sp. BWB3-3]|uniref:NAD(+)--rifampin ADP-ribosyltransferase n=1 Tax=Vagococcus allomyrinae TaxID=2794353 RepID=A0A940SXD9_9ENTE|nr:NAD(+)--rifampin ADP-ribosyltransferase [Vagococcus allomyrinae]MBP1042268.1 NAD(+)--rifampin ADP-ribosyltransferase [Vagococcus allomyrinae]
MTTEIIDQGPFFHGTKAQLKVGEELTPKYHSNFETGRISNYVYFTGTLEAAKWGAELAVGDGAERIYVVEPLGEFENDPNLTDKRFPGNPTRSFRSQKPLKIVAELATWERHSDEVINQMLANLEQLRKAGTAEILD